MKHHALLGLILWTLASAAGTAWGYYLDTPHNESNGIYCYTCHELPAFRATDWAAKRAVNPDNTMLNAVCLSCHAEAAAHNGPTMQMHSSATSAGTHGTWTTECTQCHDVHFQGQLDWATTENNKLFLAEGLFNTGIQTWLFDSNDPQGEGYGTTIVGISAVSGQAGWTDTTQWSAKGGHRDADKATDHSRGLILVTDRTNHPETFEIIAVNGNVIKVKGKMIKGVIDGGSFGVFYGQSLKSSVMPNGGTSANDYRDVKFFAPNIFPGDSGGYVDLTPSASKPVGLCQVCHDSTSAWKSDNTGASHHSDTDCDSCHNIVDAIPPVAANGSFIISASSGTTSESGTTATFTVRLGSQPTANVTIPVSTSDPSEGSVAPASLTFTNANWNTDQTITVTGASDILADGPITYSILLGLAASTDSKYNGLDPADVSVTNSDVRAASFVISASSGNTSESGTTATFTVRLGSQPTANVTIPMSSADLTEGTVSPTSLTFTNADWNTDQTVTVTGVSDGIPDGDVAYSISLGTTTSTDTLYNGLDPADVTVTNLDIPSAGFIISASSGNTSESGATATFTVRLNSSPTANVTIPVSSSDTTEGTVAPSSLTFTNTNWNTDQIVTVTGVSDGIPDGDVAYSIFLGTTTSTDSLYNGLDPADVAVTNTDIAAGEPGVVVSSLSGNPDESGGTATFTVRLGSLPTGAVTITVSSSNPNEGTVSPTLLTFTPANGTTAQTVTVTGVDDSIEDGNQTFSIVLGVASSPDSNYNNLNPDDVSVTNVDIVDAYGVTPAISAGNNHNLVLANDGSVWGWGNCFDGQLGINPSACASGVVLPRQLEISKAAAVSAGYFFSAIIKKDKTLWTSGSNEYGKLGHAGTTTFAQVEGLTDVKTVVAGTNHALALRNDGTVWAWGYGETGALGNNIKASTQSPVQAGGDLTGKSIAGLALGIYHSLAFDNSGIAYAWGSNGKEQLGFGGGLGDALSTATPTAISTLSLVTLIGAGQYQSFAYGKKASVDAYGWGNNTNNLLGISTLLPKEPTTTPTALNTFSSSVMPSKLDSGFQHSVALVGTTVYTWGDNDYLDSGVESFDNRGALGTGFETDIQTGPALAFATGGAALDVNAGSNYTLVLLNDGRLMTSGKNDAAQLGSNEIDFGIGDRYTVTPVYVEDPGDLGKLATGGSNIPFYAYRPILAGYPATSSPSATATVAVCPGTLLAPANCGPITHYKYSTNNGSSWSAATSIATPISLTGLSAGSVNLWVKGMSNANTEIQTDSSAVKIAWTVN
ncbi:MAG: hypothetical protein HGA96_13665 [Desulfobulbaceae bacterium]|nr:hypothetical protein [Desulfobulbaceae bacterium]